MKKWDSLLVIMVLICLADAGYRIYKFYNKAVGHHEKVNH